MVRRKIKIKKKSRRKIRFYFNARIKQTFYARIFFFFFFTLLSRTLSQTEKTTMLEIGIITTNKRMNEFRWWCSSEAEETRVKRQGAGGDEKQHPLDAAWKFAHVQKSSGQRWASESRERGGQEGKKHRLWSSIGKKFQRVLTNVSFFEHIFPFL